MIKKKKKKGTEKKKEKKGTKTGILRLLYTPSD